MERCQIPSHFTHIGPLESEEEDQFYKFRRQLAELFKRLASIEVIVDQVLKNLSTVFSRIIVDINAYSAE